MSTRIAKWIWILSGVFVLMMTMLTVLAADEEGKSSSKGAPQTLRSQGGCIVNEASIEDLKKAQEKNESRMKELTAREAELKVREQAVDEQIKKLEKIEANISQAEESKKKETEKKVQQLSETVLMMSPKAAAKFFDTLDEQLSVEIMSRLDTTRLAKIMNVMDPERSSTLSERLVGVAKNSFNHKKGGGSYGESIASKNANERTRPAQESKPTSSTAVSPHAAEKVANSH